MSADDAKKTTTEESLLGLLSMGPMSGYQIKQRIGESIGNFWTESYGQIYPTLKRLEAQGLVASKDEETGGERGRPSRVYALTEPGRERLREWLGVPARSQVMRNETLLKLFFSDEIGPEAAMEHARAAKQMFEMSEQRYHAIEAGLTKQWPNHPALPYWLITVRYGLAQSRALAAWADDTLAELERIGPQRARGKHS
jgi:PadR family transcriptional regulator AphA